MKLNTKQQKIISLVLEKGAAQSSAIHQAILQANDEISLVSIKRALSEMVQSGILKTTGSGRSTCYNINPIGRVFFNVDAKEYLAKEPDDRYGLSKYNFELFAEFPKEIFTKEELTRLEHATNLYHKRTQNISKILEEKELQRLIIELSWKSSRIEGNTYTLLDTEKLILEHKEATGHTKNEAQMIINHKDAFNFIRNNSNKYKTLNRVNLEKLHSLLVKNLSVGLGLRNGLVGVTGSKYQPLDNIYQIKEAIDALAILISNMKNPYTKALLALIGIGYIQPFEDGNKRTGRLMANALLLSHGCAPLSYRSISEIDYKEAMLVFYELNSIIPFKKIFIEQYEFAASNYAVK